VQEGQKFLNIFQKNPKVPEKAAVNGTERKKVESENRAFLQLLFNSFRPVFIGARQ
jgi:hypothetical protein